MAAAEAAAAVEATAAEATAAAAAAVTVGPAPALATAMTVATTAAMTVAMTAAMTVATTAEAATEAARVTETGALLAVTASACFSTLAFLLRFVRVHFPTHVLLRHSLLFLISLLAVPEAAPETAVAETNVTTTKVGVQRPTKNT
jgi:hypothetical protein